MQTLLTISCFNPSTTYESACYLGCRALCPHDASLYPVGHHGFGGLDSGHLSLPSVFLGAVSIWSFGFLNVLSLSPPRWKLAITSRVRGSPLPNFPSLLLLCHNLEVSTLETHACLPYPEGREAPWRTSEDACP